MHACQNFAYPICKSAVLQTSDNPHGVSSILQLGHFLSFTVGITELCDENIQKDYDYHSHVS
jgi:hypothetical protein